MKPIAPKSYGTVSIEDRRSSAYTYRYPHHPLVGLDPSFVRLAVEGDGAQDGSSNELYRSRDNLEFETELILICTHRIA